MAAKDSKVFLLELQMKTQGTIKGGSTKGGNTTGPRKVQIPMLHFSVAPLLPGATQPPPLTGRRQHLVVTIVSEVNSASPSLPQGLCANESFVAATLSFARPDKDGKETNTYTIQLTNGAVVRYENYHGTTGTGTGKSRGELTLSYDDVFVNGARNPALLKMLATLSRAHLTKKG